MDSGKLQSKDLTPSMHILEDVERRGAVYEK